MAGGGIFGSSKAGGFAQLVWAPGHGDLALGLEFLERHSPSAADGGAEAPTL